MSASRFVRRSFLGGTCAAAGSLAATVAAPRPAGGWFAAGSDRLRVGLIGCGGRGTGAAAQAAAADPAVRVTALADLFADQVDAALAVLDRTCGAAVACPTAGRFTGQDAWRRLMEADLDVVILATSPDARPAQAAAAVAAGRHVYCEAPAAIDAAGVAVIHAAFDKATAAGLAVGSGLAWRHDPTTIRAVAAIRDGAIGIPVAAVATSRLGPAWRRAPAPGLTPAEAAHREWISSARLSGGDFVEHQVHALDKLLWALGDEAPVLAEPSVATPTAGVAVRYRFADGRVLDAGLVRRPGGTDRIEEQVRGTRGGCDLRAAGTGAGRHRRSMAAFIGSIRGGTPLAEGQALCRSTLAAILGREAAAAGAARPWPAVVPA
jgi:predicted dehydrogenase